MVMVRRCLYYTLIPILLLFGVGCFLAVDSSFAASLNKPGESVSGHETPATDSSGDPVTGKGIVEPPGKTLMLKGRIVDVNRQPVEGAFISLSHSPFDGVRSLHDGTFLLKDIPSGPSVSLDVFKEGYFPLTQSIDPSTLLQRDPEVFSLIPLPVGAALPLESQGTSPTKEAVQIEADSLSYDRATDVYHARGQVVISYTDGILRAASADLYHKQNEALVEGQVVMTSKDGDVIEGDRARLSIDKQTGVIEAGRVFIARTHFYVRGDRIEKRGEATYFIANAEATTCDGPAPDWRLTGKSLDVTIDGYGTLKDGRLYAKTVPFIYSPYLFFPVKTTRQSGFLLPQRMAYSRERLGMDVSVPFFWAISKDSDATLHQRFMSERGFQEGVEYRYALNKHSLGTLYGDFLNDRKKITETVGNINRNWQTEQKRWSLYLNHESRFDPTFYVRADISKVSDSFYFRDFSSYNYFQANYVRTNTEPFKKIMFVGDESLNYLDSTVRLSKTWQNYNLTTLVKSTQDLTVATNDATLQKYPEVTLSGIKQPLLGTPLQYELSGVYDYFYRGDGQKGHLLDAYPALSLPFAFRDYFQITPFAGIRSLTWKREDNVTDGLSKQDHLETYATGATVSGEMQRIFQVGGKSMEKLRHAIRPEVTYFYSSSGGRPENLPNFVTTATQQNTPNTTLSQLLSMQSGTATAAMASDQNAVIYSLTNTLTARMKVKEGGKRYQEFLRFKVAQFYDLKEAGKEVVPANTNRRPLSDVNMEMDVTPVPYLTISARNRYNIYDTAWTQENYDLSVRDGRGDTASVTYRYTQNSIKETNLVLKAVITKSLDLNFRMKRDHFNERDIEKLYGFTYRSQCWTFGFDYGDSSTDKVFAFRFSIYGL